MQKDNSLRQLPPSGALKDSIQQLMMFPAKNLLVQKKQLDRVISEFHADLEKHPFEPPVEPNDSQLISRIFSSEKFIRFLANPSFYMYTPGKFIDPCEGKYPDEVYAEHTTGVDAWINETINNDEYSDLLEAVSWLVRDIRIDFPAGTCSCWTLIDDHRSFSELLWQHHAGSQNGVALIGTYGDLKQHFRNNTYDEDLMSGKVSYSVDDARYHPAFKKRPAFIDEEEVRFFSPMNPDPFLTEVDHQTLQLEIGFSEDVEATFRKEVHSLAFRIHPKLFVEAIK